MDALAGVSSEDAVANGGGSGTGGLFSSSTSLLLPTDTGVSIQRGPFGSVLQKHDRRPSEAEGYDWRSLKVARSDALAAAPAKAAPFLLRSETHPLFPDGEQMLSFSSASESEMVTDATLAYYNHLSVTSSSAQCYLRANAGLVSANSNGNMQSVLARVRGPFTPSQWLELEHQALIYKYLLANAPIPASLLVPLRRSLGASFWFPPLAAGSFNSVVGWGSFNSKNTDPEPGRCRRTDGKKWRCSRDAVADQKYCERHMNRGRHRSRKHVEGQSGHASITTPVVASSQPASALPGGTCSATLKVAQQQSKSLQSNIKDPHAVQYNGMPSSNEEQNSYAQNSKSLSVASLVCQSPQSNFYPISKQQAIFEGTSSGSDLEVFPNDSLLNPSWSSLSDNISSIPTPKLNHQDVQSNPLRHFMDDCPKTQSDGPTTTWPEVEESYSARTQLSISIPMACSDFSSSTSSNPDILTPSPLKLSSEYEYDCVHMGLGAGVLTDVCQRQANWRPLSWEASMAGPLGEVLNSTGGTPKDQSKNSSMSLNLLADVWDSCTQMESSPTGVLQKTSFASLSSSTGSSSPRVENLMLHNSTSSLCSDYNASTLVNAPTTPPLQSPS